MQNNEVSGRPSKRSSDGKRVATCGIEKMCARRIRIQSDTIAGTAARAIADQRRNLLSIETAEELRVGAGGLDDDDIGGQSGTLGEPEVLRPNAIEYRLPVDGSRGRRCGQRHAAFAFDNGPDGVPTRKAGDHAPR